MKERQPIAPPQTEWLSPESSHALARIALKAFNPIPKSETSDETMANLDSINTHLENHSIIIVGYHQSISDAVIYPLILRGLLPNLHRIFAPIAADHHHLPITKAWEFTAAKLLRTHFFPVVRKGNLKDQEYKSQEGGYFLNLMRHTRKQLKNPNGAFAIDPEGTRSDTLQDVSKLNNSYVGNKINRTGDTKYVVAAAFKLEEKINNEAEFEKEAESKVETKTTFQFRISSLLQLPENPKSKLPKIEDAQRAERNSTFIMENLADLLPKELHGPYTPFSEK